MKTLLVAISLFLTINLCAQMPQTSSGEIIRHADFPSQFVDARNIDVWLPEGYSENEKYAVLYMHDGQMLFDKTTTWNKQEWGVDEVLTDLYKQQAINKCIVVGIWNNDNKRHAEYFPQRAWQIIDEAEQSAILEKDDAFVNESMIKEGLLADEYLKFIVRELKPFIDNKYNTKADKNNTFIMGSSMGGLISCYAICEYPGIFGAAVCMSTHWPAVDGITVNYLKNHLPNPNTHKIYFDYGTATLDALYEPYQLKVNKIMKKNGFVMDDSFVSKKFEGEPHTEIAWNKRLHIPLRYILEQ